MAWLGRKKEAKKEVLQNPQMREQIKKDIAQAEGENRNAQEEFYNSIANSPEYVYKARVLQELIMINQHITILNESLKVMIVNLKELKDIANNDSLPVPKPNDNEEGF